MENDPTNLERIAALEHALQATESKAQKYAQELENLRQQYADNLFEERKINKRLHEEHHQLQRDYGQLRVQKGGFGIKVLVLSGFSGFLTGVLLCAVYVIFLKPKDPHTALFAEFKDAHQFNYERAITAGDFESVERDLQLNLEAREYKPIHPEIEFVKKIVGAAKRRCDKSGN